jgi:hypothetical protein
MSHSHLARSGTARVGLTTATAGDTVCVTNPAQPRDRVELGNLLQPKGRGQLQERDGHASRQCH